MMTLRFLTALTTAATMAIAVTGCQKADAEAEGYRSVTHQDATAEPDSDEPVQPGLTGDAPADATGTSDNTPDDPPAVDTVESPGEASPEAVADASTDTTSEPDSVATTTDVEAAPGGAATTGSETQPDTPGDEPAQETVGLTVESKEPLPIKLLVPERDFKTEGPDKALRVSFDDVDLLKILNMEPVVANAPELMPDWLTGLNGKRIRLRGFMYPPFQDTGLEAFILARDNQICCFGRDPKVYDLVRVLMRDGETTDYIENRPFDVVGVFTIGDDASIPGKLYTLDDAIVISR